MTMEHKKGLCGEPNIPDNVARSALARIEPRCLCCNTPMNIEELLRPRAVPELSYKLVCPKCPPDMQRQKAGEDLVCKHCGSSTWRLNICNTNRGFVNVHAFCEQCGKDLSRGVLGDHYTLCAQSLHFVTLRRKKLAELTGEDVPTGLDLYDLAIDAPLHR
jgi:hypothetical protein